MFFAKGHLPVICVVILSAASALDANAKYQVLLTLAEAEDLALESEPGRLAMLAQANAFEERAVAAGSLPEPTLRLGLNNFPIESGGFSTEGMTHALVGIRQAIPPGRSRAMDTRRHTALAESLTLAAAARDRDVLVAVRRSWLDAWYWERAHELVTESRPFFDDLSGITRSLYAVGRRTRQDVLRAELELSRLDDRLLEIARQREQARAALGQWIGDAAARPIADKLPDWPTLPSRQSMFGQLSTHPVLQAADARIAAGQASVELAGEQKKPGWAIDLGYSYREGMLPDGSPRSDFLSLAVTVDLPFLGGRQRQDRRLAAALSERRAAMSLREQLSRQLGSELQGAYARWQQVDRRVALYEERILKQTRDQAQAALAAYQRDSGDFADVMRSYIDELDARLEHVQLRVDRARSYAELASIGGLSR